MEGPGDLVGLPIWGSGGDIGFTRDGTHDLEQVVRDATSGKGANIALNGVGASVLFTFLNCLAAGGRMVVSSVAFGGKDAILDLFALYRKRHQIFGLDTVAINVVEGSKILSEVTPLFENGKLSKPRIAERYPLTDAIKAYERVASAKGKVVLQMA